MEKERKVSEYYKKQEKLLEGFNEMETINETGFVSGAPASNRGRDEEACQELEACSTHLKRSKPCAFRSKSLCFC
ncbi:hypothetical protein Bca52824_085098 [Brassica carinata]|uniref:Uncharacterized protein n=1 Tax=Brassica carinata TaxID=52824 RepID=A0A8X7PPV7_BRACI|nr:hypothetical protein Bca52824_085098 [Brassica carinata]